ncbi:MAG: hypothetical protein LUD46_07240 [Parabacteroides sp.]|nr:hypothetical protein [Parabacteroides sp.]
MKKKELYALACIFSFAGCSSPNPDESVIVENLFPVQFSVQLQKEVLPFYPTRSMPDNTIPEPTVPNPSDPDKDQPDNPTDKELSELCSTIEYVVYNSNNPTEPVNHHIYNNVETEDFGIIYDTLPAGTYKACFFAYQSEKATFSDNVLSFDRLSDSFYETESFTVGEGLESAMSIDLRRIVSRIEFKATDQVPDEIEKFEMKISNYPNRFDLLTGEGITSETEQTFTDSFASEDKGKTGKIHSFYSFIPSGNKKISVMLTSTNAAEQVMRTRTVTDITPIANKIIRYTGILYTPPKPDETGNTFSLSINGNGEWDDTEEKELPELLN